MLECFALTSFVFILSINKLTFMEVCFARIMFRADYLLICNLFNSSALFGPTSNSIALYFNIWGIIIKDSNLRPLDDEAWALLPCYNRCCLIVQVHLVVSLKNSFLVHRHFLSSCFSAACLFRDFFADVCV